MNIARPELLSVMNKTQILNLLRTKGPISRAGISRALSISFPTVSANVKSLIEAGIISEGGEGDNELGRKSKLLKYNSKVGYVIGGDIGRNSIQIILADLEGNIVDEITRNLDKGTFTKDTLSALDTSIDFMLRKEGIVPECILSVCIGVPYRIDSTSRANYLNLSSDDPQNIRLDKYFELKFNAPVRVENSINLGVLGEKNYGAGKNFHNIFYIDFGVGIGSALLLNDTLFCGGNGAAGEISYSIADTNRVRTSYCDDGILEELIASAGEIVGLQHNDNKHIQEMKPIFDRALQYDKAAQDFLDLIARYFSVILVNSVSLINPDVVIFSGGVGVHLLERYYNTFLRFLSVHIPFVPQLIPSTLGKKGNSLGAVSVAMEHIHKDYAVLEKALHKVTFERPLIKF